MRHDARAVALGAILAWCFLQFAGGMESKAVEPGGVAPSLRGVHSWPHSVAAPPAAAGDDAASRCKALVGDFSDLEDAPSQVISADIVPASAGVPTVCRLRGYSAPRIGFELDLPTDQWNGKFLYHGCFGLCGVIGSVACNEPIARGYACVLGDTGHTSTASDAKWAYNDLQAEFDFAIRATHVTTLVGKALVARFYQSGAKRSYFLGCSGGRPTGDDGGATLPVGLRRHRRRRARHWQPSHLDVGRDRTPRQQRQGPAVPHGHCDRRPGGRPAMRG